MKKLIVTLFILFSFNFCKAQNLVVNGDFEMYNNCPLGCLSNINSANGWHGFSTDYYNSCATNNFMVGGGIPKNCYGFQYAFDGNAYGGLITYTDNMGSGTYREFIQSQLLSRLIIGTKYYVSIKSCLANSTYPCSSNNLGVLFSNNIFPDDKYAPIRNFAQVYSPNIVNDTLNWITISGYFVADSQYQYLSIGNFFDSTHTSYITGAFGLAYYYIDKVCVSSNPLECGLISDGIINSSKQDIKISTNPLSNYLTITSPSIQNSTFKIHNLLGQEIKYQASSSMYKDKMEIDVSSFPNGIYFLQAENLKPVKFVVQH